MPVLRRGAVALAAVVALALGLPASVPSSAAQVPVAERCDNRRPSGDWLLVGLPTHRDGTGPDVATVHAVHAADPDTMVVSNGVSVQRSLDGGCTWEEVLRLPERPTPAVPHSALTTRIVALALPAHPGDRGRVLALALDGSEVHHPVSGGSAGAKSRPVLFVSEDLGASWQLGGDGLLADMQPSGDIGRCNWRTSCALVAPASRPGLVYVSASSQSFQRWPLLFASTDGGHRFELRGTALDPAGQASQDGANVYPSVGGFAVDPGDPDRLWQSAKALLHSDDGGRSWAVQGDGRAFVAPLLDAWSAPGTPARMLELRAGSGISHPIRVTSISRSDDGGRRYTTTDAELLGLDEISVDSIATGDGPDDIVLAAHEPDALLAWSPATGRFVDVDRDGVAAAHGPLTDVRATAAGFAALGRGVLAFYQGPVGHDVRPGEEVTVDLGGVADANGELRQACAGVEGDDTGVLTNGAWTVLVRPEFPPVPPPTPAHEPPQPAIRHFAVDPADPERVYISDGSSVLRTDDGGCSWQLVYELAEGVDAAHGFGRATGAEIMQVVVPESRASGERVHLVVWDISAGVYRPHVLTSSDGGASWTTGRGLPATTQLSRDGRCGAHRSLCGLVVAPSEPDVLYLHARGRAIYDGDGVLYGSSDGGRTWTERDRSRRNGGLLGDNEIASLQVDPHAPDALWALVGDGVLRSTDGGRTWEPPSLLGGGRTLRLLDVHRERGDPARVVTFEPGGFAGLSAVAWSDDGGVTFDVRAGQGIVGTPTSLAHGTTVDDLVVSTASGVYLHIAALDAWVDLEVPGLPELDSAQADRSSDPSYWFRSDDAVAWVHPPHLASVRALLPELADFSLPPLRDPAPASLTGPRRLDLDVGEERTAPYRLVLPARPTPLDIFFLTDSSGSMGDDIRALGAGMERIVQDIADRRVPLAVGLGDYADWSRRYRRLHDISVPDAELVRKLRSMRTGGGTEVAFTALHQMSTGSGIAPVTVGEPVPPGQQANFRDGSLRFVVHISDEPLQPDPDGPDPVTTLAALNERGIGHIGLIARGDETLVVRAGMSALSLGTGTVAPPGGVDCDGDGEADVPEGAPLVCEIPDDGSRPDLATPIVDILRSIEDRQPLSVEAEGPDGVVVGVEVPAGAESLDVTVDHALDVDLTVACPASRAGEEVPVSLEATLRGEAVASRAVTVACAVPPPAPGSTAPPPQVPIVAVPEPAAPVAALLPLLPPPPVPIPANAPATATAGAQAQAQAQAQASAGAAAVQPGVTGAAVTEEERQVQVALAQAGISRGPAVLPFARRTTTSTDAARLAGAASLVAGAAALLHRRSRPTPYGTVVARHRR
jgi:photosystem II stability/assembly factor-like uncharacterized protein